MSADIKQLAEILGEADVAPHTTAGKAAFIMARDNSKVTGFVLTNEFGGIGIVDKGAVRWLTQDEHWQLMHPPT